MYVNPELTNSFEIIVGTYEQYLLGYKVYNVVNEYNIEASFATHSHVASVRSVSSNKYYLASAGADEMVCLYDMRSRRESVKLMHHKDTINCVAFTPEGSHLFACSSDGSISAVRCGNWQLDKLWPTAHKGSAVNTIAIHPTGKLALSTGEDGVLRTWNLIKGRQAYATNLVPKLKADAKWITIVKWSPSGEKYLLAVNEKIYVYSVESASIDKELAFDSKVICVEFLEDTLIAIGFENGEIRFCDLRTSVHTINIKAHNMRVKCIAHMNDFLVSASSSGEIKLWKYKTHSLDILKTVNCNTRITCLSLAQIYKDLIQQEEVKLDEGKKIKEKSKFRLDQEVIIEHEDEQEITEVTNPQPKTSKIKHKRKRSMENNVQNLKKKLSESKEQEITEVTNPQPKTSKIKRKRKRSMENNVQNLKKKLSESKETTTFKRKIDRLSQAEDVVDDKPEKKQKLLKVNSLSEKRKQNSAASQIISPTKKMRKTDKHEVSSLSSRKHKAKLLTTDIEDVPPKKINKKVNAVKEIVPKRKKRKITH